MTRSACILALLLAGCASTTPQWDQRFGHTVGTALAAQVLDPAAATHPRPGDSLDGRAAKRAQERYEQSFTEKQAPESLMNGLAK